MARPADVPPEAGRTEPVRPVLEFDPRLGNVLFDIWLVSRATAALIAAAVQASGPYYGDVLTYAILPPTKGLPTNRPPERLASAP